MSWLMPLIKVILFPFKEVRVWIREPPPEIEGPVSIRVPASYWLLNFNIFTDPRYRKLYMYSDHLYIGF